MKWIGALFLMLYSACGGCPPADGCFWYESKDGQCIPHIQQSAPATCTSED